MKNKPIKLRNKGYIATAILLHLDQISLNKKFDVKPTLIEIHIMNTSWIN